MAGRNPGERNTNVRWREETGFEMRCPRCSERRRPGPTFWPLTEEFWNVREGLARCRACVLELKRLERQEAKRRSRTSRMDNLTSSS